MSNIEILHAALLDSLIPTRPQFKQAEQNLRTLALQPGFAPLLLDTIMSPQLDLGVRQAAAVYLKNKVTRSWSSTTISPLNAEDKQYIKSQILDCIANTPLNLREFLLVCLSTILTFDHRSSQWTELFVKINEFIEDTSDLNRVVAGLQILKQVVRFHRWSTVKVNNELEPIMLNVYPYILQIMELSLTALYSNDVKETYYQLIYEIMKIYKLSTARFLPSIVREQKMAIRTFECFLRTLQLPVTSDSSYFAQKCIKWSACSIKKTYTTQLSKNYIHLSDDSKEYAPYRALLLDVFGFEVTNVFVQVLLDWSNGQKFLGDQALINMVLYLTLILEHRKIYTQCLHPKLESLISNVIFTMMSPTENDLDLFEDDPAEFINSKLDFFDSGMSKPEAACRFVSTLVKKRSSTLEPMLAFFEQSAQTYQSSGDLRGVIAALKLLQALAPSLLSSGSSAKIEQLLTNYVLPVFNTNNDYLRSEVCETISKCSSLEFSNKETLNYILQGIIACVTNSTCLPLQVSAAKTLKQLTMDQNQNQTQDLTQDPSQAQTQTQNSSELMVALGDHVPQLISVLLGIADKFDSDPLFDVINHFVDSYPLQVTPFAVSMAGNLAAHFVSVVSFFKEHNEISNSNGSGSSGGNATEDDAKIDEKMSTALGILSSLGTLLLSLDLDKETVANIELAINPVFECIYEMRFSDFYPECLDLHENVIRASNSVSCLQWKYFDLIISMLAQAEYERVEDTTALLQAFIIYGTQEFKTNKQKFQMFVQTLTTMYQPQQVETNRTKQDLIYDVSSVSAEADSRRQVMYMLTFLISSQYVCQSDVSDVIPLIIESTCARINIDNYMELVAPPRYNVVLLSTIEICIACNPTLSLQIVDKLIGTDNFLDMFFQCQSELNTIFDHQVSVICILALLSQCANHPAVQMSFKHLGHLLADSLNKLPGAVKRAHDLLEYDYLDDDFADYDDGFGGGMDDQVDLDDLENGTENGTGAGANNINIEESVYSNASEGVSPNQKEDDDGYFTLDNLGFLADDFSDSLLIVSPLDNVNVLDTLRQTFPSFSSYLESSGLAIEDQQIIATNLQTERIAGTEELLKLINEKGQQI